MVEQVLSRREVLVMGAIAACYFAVKAVAGIDIAGLGTLTTESQHPVDAHGLEDVGKVIAAMRMLSAEFFRKQKPCVDGIWRLVIPDVDSRHLGLIVMIKTGEGFFSLKTAFVMRTKSKYAQNVMDKCFGRSAYA